MDVQGNVDELLNKLSEMVPENRDEQKAKVDSLGYDSYIQTLGGHISSLQSLISATHVKADNSTGIFTHDMLNELEIYMGDYDGTRFGDDVAPLRGGGLLYFYQKAVSIIPQRRFSQKQKVFLVAILEKFRFYRKVGLEFGREYRERLLELYRIIQGIMQGVMQNREVIRVLQGKTTSRINILLKGQTIWDYHPGVLIWTIGKLEELGVTIDPHLKARSVLLKSTYEGVYSRFSEA